MRKYIGTKKYDTDTAKNCGEWANGLSGDYAVTEILYRKSTGEYFLYGSGGPSSCYSSVRSANCHKPGEMILPMSYEEAYDWATEKLSATMLNSVFVKDSLRKHTYTFRLTDSAHAKLIELAAKKGMTKSAVLEWLLSSV